MKNFKQAAGLIFIVGAILFGNPDAYADDTRQEELAICTATNMALFAIIEKQNPTLSAIFMQEAKRLVLAMNGSVDDNRKEVTAWLNNIQLGYNAGQIEYQPLLDVSQECSMLW